MAQSPFWDMVRQSLCSGETSSRFEGWDRMTEIMEFKETFWIFFIRIFSFVFYGILRFFALNGDFLAIVKGILFQHFSPK